MLVFPFLDFEDVGLEGSGRSVGFISTNSHTHKSSWCRVVTKKTNTLTSKQVTSISMRAYCNPYDLNQAQAKNIEKRHCRTKGLDPPASHAVDFRKNNRYVCMIQDFDFRIKNIHYEISYLILSDFLLSPYEHSRSSTMPEKISAPYHLF